MSWQTPKTNWSCDTYFDLVTDFNRIESNLQHIYDNYKNLFPAITFLPIKTWEIDNVPSTADVQRIYSNVNAISSWFQNSIDNSLFPSLIFTDILSYLMLNEIETRIGDLLNKCNANPTPVALYDKNKLMVCDNTSNTVNLANNTPSQTVYSSTKSTSEIDQFITNVLSK